jgi:DNA anti-recombination protein RmuC
MIPVILFSTLSFMGGAGRAGVAWPAFLGAGFSPAEADWLVHGLVVIASILGILVALKVLRQPPAKMPFETRAVVAYVEEPKFATFEKYVHERNHALSTQLQHLELAAEERRTEAADQLSTLRVQIDERINDAIKASNQSASKIYTRIEQLAENVATQRGSKESTDQQLGEIRRLLIERGFNGNGGQRS